jgi:hypothetical protein
VVVGRIGMDGIFGIKIVPSCGGPSDSGWSMVCDGRVSCCGGPSDSDKLGL